MVCKILPNFFCYIHVHVHCNSMHSHAFGLEGDELTHQIFYSVDFVSVGEHAGAVVSEQVEQIGRLGDVQTNIVPVIEILEEGGRGKVWLSLSFSLSLSLSLSPFVSLSHFLSVCFC